jgi:hypothetical protein
MNEGITGSIKVKNLPWAEIGTDISQCATVDEILDTAKLNYEVVLRHPTIEGKRIDDFFAITKVVVDGLYRTVDVFGFVKTRYIVPQNRSSFEFFDKFIEEAGATYEYAGSLDRGEMVWIVAKLPEYVDIKETRISFYVMFSIYQTGKHGRRITIFPVREICNNVLISPCHHAPNFMSLPNKTTLAAEQEILDDIYDLKDKYIKTTKARFEELAKSEVTTKQEKDFFNKVVTSNNENAVADLSGRFANRIAAMSDYYRNHPSQETIYGTLFGLYNAVAGYYHNIKDYTSPTKRFATILIGGDAYRGTEDSFQLSQKILPQTRSSN